MKMNLNLFSSMQSRERVSGQTRCHSADFLSVCLARLWRPVVLGLLRILLFVTTMGDLFSWASCGDPGAFLWRVLFPHLAVSDLSLCSQLVLWAGFPVMLLLFAIQTPLLDVAPDDVRHALSITLLCTVFCILLFGLLWLVGLPASIALSAGVPFWMALLGCLALGTSLNCPAQPASSSPVSLPVFFRKD